MNTKMSVLIFVFGFNSKLIIKKIKIGIKENDDNLIIFLPLIITPEIIG